MNQFTGSNFDDFLAQEGILDEVSVKAHKRLLALQLEDIMQQSNMTKTRLAQLSVITDQLSQITEMLSVNSDQLSVISNQ
jgi:antitoxin HicB